MNIRMAQQDLVDAFRIVSGLRVVRPGLKRQEIPDPELAFVSLRDRMALVAGNDRLWVRITIPVDGDLPDDPVITTLSRFNDAVQFLSRSSTKEVMLTTQGERILIRAGSHVAEIERVSSRYAGPDLVEIEKTPTVICAHAQHLSDCLRFAVFFLGDAEEAWLHFHSDGDRLWLFLRDRFRVAATSLLGSKARLDTAIDGWHAKTIQGLIEKAVDYFGNARARLQDAGEYLAIQLEDWLGLVAPKRGHTLNPDWGSFMQEPEAWEAVVTLNRRDVEQLVIHLSKTTPNDLVTLFLDNQSLTVITNRGTIQLGTQIEWAKHANTRMQIEVNATRLKDAIRSFGKQPPRVIIGEPASPICFVAPDRGHLHWLLTTNPKRDRQRDRQSGFHQTGGPVGSERKRHLTNGER